MEGCERDWRERIAETLILGGATGPLVGFARRQDEDGELCWEKRQVPKSEVDEQREKS